MWEKIQQIWKIKEIRNKILYVLGMLVVFRLVAHIPIPGVNLLNLRQFLESNKIFGFLDVFSGGRCL
jgi:preprotein translocase subunit SecY